MEQLLASISPMHTTHSLETLHLAVGLVFPSPICLDQLALAVT